MEKWVLRPKQWQQISKNIKYLICKKRISWQCLRPLPVLTVAVAAGVFAASDFPWILVPAVCVFLFLFYQRINILPIWLPILIPMVFSISALHTMTIIKPARDQANQIAGETFNLQGKVLSVPNSSGQPGFIIVRQSNGIRIVLFLRYGSPDVKYGDIISALVRCRLPDRQRNPGGFNEKNWLISQGISLIAYPVSAGELTIISREPRLGIVNFSADMRVAFSRVMDRLLENSQSVLLTGLLIGDTSRISDEMNFDFQHAGLAHLLSVSGANVSYILLPAGRLLKKLRSGRQIRLIVLIILLVGFGFLTGWQTSVTRAILMSGFVMAGRLLHRQSDSISSLSAATLVLLIIKPLTALNVGFWLSVTGTASLMMFTEPLSDKIRQFWPIPDVLADAIAATASIQMIIMPLLVSAGSDVSLPGFLANLAAGPLTVMITWMTALVIPLPIIFEQVFGIDIPLAMIQQIGRPLGILINLLIWLAKMTARIQIGRLSVGLLNNAFWLLWFLTVIYCLIRIRRKKTLFNLFQKIVCFLIKPAFAVWLVCIAIQFMSAPLFQVWFFDVGQGDAILIIGRKGETVLIDGGSSGCGVNILIPAFNALGVRKVDLAILSHGHADHAGGIIDLIGAGRIKHLAVSAAEAGWATADWHNRVKNNEQKNDTDLTYSVLESAKSAQIVVSEISGNDTIDLGQLSRLDILNKQLDGQQITDVNGFSLLILAELASCRVLLTADCTEEMENRLMVDDQWPAADILKVAHHGSRFTTSEGFLSRVQPSDSIICVGSNMYGHPAPATIARLQDAGSQIHRTDLNGAVCLKIYEHHWQMVRYCP